MLKNLNWIITSVDFLSEKPQLLINKSVRSKTIYGGILSLIPLICISIAIVVFGYGMLSRSNSTLTYNQVPVDDITFDYGQFPFMVALLDNGIKLIDEEDRYYYFLADVWNFSPDNSTGSLVMNLKREKIFQN